MKTSDIVKHFTQEGIARSTVYNAIEELSGKLTNNLYRSSVEVVMDDEKCFTLSGHKIPGNAGYYSSDKSKCPDKVRFAVKEKYPTKVLIWIAISARGISKPLIRPSEAINSDIYINKWLTKRLLPFIHEHHPDFNYILWQLWCRWTRTSTMSPSHSTLQMSRT